MDLSRAFEKARKIETNQNNPTGEALIARLQREYLDALASGTILGPLPTQTSPLGERLRGHRLDRDLTQEELAQKAKISLNTLQKLESGRTRTMQYDTLKRLVKAFSPMDESEAMDLLKLASEQSPQSRRRGPRRRH